MTEARSAALNFQLSPYNKWRADFTSARHLAGTIKFPTADQITICVAGSLQSLMPPEFTALAVTGYTKPGVSPEKVWLGAVVCATSTGTAGAFGVTTGQLSIAAPAIGTALAARSPLRWPSFTISDGTWPGMDSMSFP